MFAGSAVVGLVLWNAFPMRMRGAERSLTDTMHLILATNPFVLLSLVVAIAAFSNAGALDMSQPTPWLGLTERVAQYSYEVWQVAVALALLKRPGLTEQAARALRILGRAGRAPAILPRLVAVATVGHAAPPPPAGGRCPAWAWARGVPSMPTPLQDRPWALFLLTGPRIGNLNGRLMFDEIIRRRLQ